MHRLLSRVSADPRFQTLERVGDRLLTRFVPKATAHAACCGTCCCVQYKCEGGVMSCLRTCYAEKFEGCFPYWQHWMPLYGC